MGEMLMGNVLVVVPATLGVKKLDVFAGTRTVVLDELLFQGLAGVYFRRMLMQVALRPAMRANYDAQRHQYLRNILAILKFPDDCVFIGTQAVDVDLMHFASVYGVRVADRGLRDMSRAVYGDPVMMNLEYLSVQYSLEEAVDEWFTITSWLQLPMLLMRNFPHRQHAEVSMSIVRQRAMLESVLDENQEAGVWLEESLYCESVQKTTVFLADYDYLSMILPVWRDAVVRQLGSAPSVAEVFRLPWCVADANKFSAMCYRANINGRPSASARGESLIDFVRERLAGVLTAREMIGTWIGGLLCDDLTAIDTIAALGKHHVLASSDGTRARSHYAVTPLLEVPTEYAWMYEAVNGVVARPWDGERALDGTLRLDSSQRKWAATLPLASVFADYGTTQEKAAVVQFLYRLHSLSLDARFLRRLCDHARAIALDGCDRDSFDNRLTPLLPGYGYLMCFVRTARMDAAMVLRALPHVDEALHYATVSQGPDLLLSPDELCADLSRNVLFSGNFQSSVLVGAAEFDDIDPGYCYLIMFQQEHRQYLRDKLGLYPCLADVMLHSFTPYRIANALDNVLVTHGTCTFPNGHSGHVLHFSYAEGMPLRYYLYQYGAFSGQVKEVLSGIPVGQSPDNSASAVCYSITWYVAAIIGWTVVIVGFVAIGVWLLYLRCSGGRRRHR